MVPEQRNRYNAADRLMSLSFDCGSICYNHYELLTIQSSLQWVERSNARGRHLYPYHVKPVFGSNFGRFCVHLGCCLFCRPTRANDVKRSRLLPFVDELQNRTFVFLRCFLPSPKSIGNSVSLTLVYWKTLSVRVVSLSFLFVCCCCCFRRNMRSRYYYWAP